MCFVFLGFDTIVMAVLNGRYEWQDRILKARREIRKKIEKSAVWFWLHAHIRDILALFLLSKFMRETRFKSPNSAYLTHISSFLT